eukprot:2779698-Amphidinium_carterae.1
MLVMSSLHSGPALHPSSQVQTSHQPAHWAQPQEVIVAAALRSITPRNQKVLADKELSFVAQ